jgi:hypothetical protein
LDDIQAQGEVFHEDLFWAFKCLETIEEPNAFVRYVEDQKNKWEDGPDLTADKLCHSAETKFKLLSEAGKWKLINPTKGSIKSTEDAKFLALVTAVKELAKNSSTSTKSSISNDNKKSKWKFEAPAAGESTEKEVDGKTFWWCDISVCPLTYGVFTDVVNLDRFNLFLLGLQSLSNMAFLSGLLLLHEISLLFFGLVGEVVKAYFVKRPKKPPDISLHTQEVENTDHSYVACSSTNEDNLQNAGFYCNDFDSERASMVGLDSLCSRHLFPDKTNFVSDITPIEPFGIQGVGGDIKAIGKGTVRIRFYCDRDIPQDKLLPNAYYAPKCPVRLISIPQLARDTNDSSSLCTGDHKSIFKWEDVQVTVPHPSPSDVPFMKSYLGAPKYKAFYSLCALAQSSLADHHDDQSHHCYHAASTLSDKSHPNVVHNDSTHDGDQATALDLNDTLDQNIDHIRSLLQHPMTSPKQLEYQSWHYCLGHLSHLQMQDLVKQGKLLQHFLTCKAPVCPACLFAKQVKHSWHHKTSSHHSLRSLAEDIPGGLAFTDQMISTTPGYRHKCCVITLGVSHFFTFFCDKNGQKESLATHSPSLLIKVQNYPTISTFGNCYFYSGKRKEVKG